MRLFIIVAIACALLVGFVALHKPGGALLVGIVAGTWYFLGAVTRGGGIAQMRITQDPGQPRKPADPAGSIGMGLAASGIAAAAMSNTDYPQSFRIWYGVIFVLGLVIALAFAGKTLLMERRARTNERNEQS